MGSMRWDKAEVTEIKGRVDLSGLAVRDPDDRAREDPILAPNSP
jgi:hypothetical protein